MTNDQCHHLPCAADRVLIAFNPKAGRHSSVKLVERLASLLDRHRFDVQALSDLDEIAALANQWQAEGRLRALVGVGGDGTATELVNRTHKEVPITLLACGTANLLAKHVGLCSRPERLCETIVAGKTVRLDVGRADNRLFLAMLGCGLDAEVVQRMHHWRNSHREGHIGYLSYVKPILESIRNYDYPAIQLSWNECSDDRHEPQVGGKVARWVFIFNLPRYGWGVRFVPLASPEDGLLDLCAFECGSWWSGLWYTTAAQLGLHRCISDCLTRRGGRFRIEADRPVAYQLDGDPGGVLPVSVEVLPGRLTLLVPERYAVARRSVRRGIDAED